MFDWQMHEILERHLEAQPDHNRWWQRFRKAPGRANKETGDIIHEIAVEKAHIQEMRQGKLDVMAHRERNVWQYEIQ